LGSEKMAGKMQSCPKAHKHNRMSQRLVSSHSADQTSFHPTGRSNSKGKALLCRMPAPAPKHDALPSAASVNTAWPQKQWQGMQHRHRQTRPKHAEPLMRTRRTTQKAAQQTPCASQAHKRCRGSNRHAAQAHQTPQTRWHRCAGGPPQHGDCMAIRGI
jgi:hypothetical protein